MTETKRPTDFILAGASIFAEKRDTNVEPTREGLALRELLVSAFTGLPPSVDSLKVLQEGQRHPKPEGWIKPLTERTIVKRGPRRKVGRQREGPGYRTDIEILENFQLPDDVTKAEKYCDQLVASGVDEYRVWQNCQHWFATRGT